jgi:hypothetical protein
MSESEPLKIAIKRFNGPYSCSQAVFSAFAPRYGLSDELALKIAAPLGGGMARQGHVCGAVSGALMVLGLARGSTTVLCRELIGYDFSVPEEARAAREARISSQVCPAFVHTAAEILVDLLG